MPAPTEIPASKAPVEEAVEVEAPAQEIKSSVMDTLRQELEIAELRPMGKVFVKIDAFNKAIKSAQSIPELKEIKILAHQKSIAGQLGEGKNYTKIKQKISNRGSEILGE